MKDITRTLQSLGKLAASNELDEAIELAQEMTKSNRTANAVLKELSWHDDVAKSLRNKSLKRGDQFTDDNIKTCIQNLINSVKGRILQDVKKDKKGIGNKTIDRSFSENVKRGSRPASAEPDSADREISRDNPTGEKGEKPDLKKMFGRDEV